MYVFFIPEPSDGGSADPRDIICTRTTQKMTGTRMEKSRTVTQPKPYIVTSRFVLRVQARNESWGAFNTGSRMTLGCL